MTSPLWKRLQLLVSVVSVLLVVAVLVAVGGWWRMRGSLPLLDGEVKVTGLTAPVTVERDALGVPTIAGANRIDVAQALGFVHAQDRFFQMDLLRRTGAGELAELFGSIAVGLDQGHRLHGFRRNASKVVAAMLPEHRAIVDAYTAGVNAGLAALPKSPWEYVVLRSTPQPWRAEDTVLVIYAMWFDLQDASGRFELSLQALREALGQDAVEFFAPRGTSWDSALDGTTFPAPALPSFRLRRGGNAGGATVPGGEGEHPGSNAFAVVGAKSANGGALVANDMHLSLALPHIWYRAVMQWPTENGGMRRLAGVTLPGTPALIAGSNGDIAWGFTNSNVDTIDVVRVETENTAQAYYRTPSGYRPIEDREEKIEVRGEAPVTFKARWTEWGPLIGNADPGQFFALRWSAHDVDSTNLEILGLESATSVQEAIAVAHRAGMPNENLVVADRTGSIAWTITGRVPRRVGYDGRFPVSWAYGDRYWDGWLKPEEIPVVENPTDGLIWSANQRLVGGEAFTRLGDNGFDDGPRARIIHEDLQTLTRDGQKVDAKAMLGVMLDDRALFLERWQKELLATLTDDVVAKKRAYRELRDVVRTWNGHASIDSAAFRLVRAWRLRVADLAFAPFSDRARSHYSDFAYVSFQFDDALWTLAHDKPEGLLNPDYPSWAALLLDAADRVLAEVDRSGLGPERFTWGEANTLRMRHPFSRVVPAMLGRYLDMPAKPLPGSADMPRVQNPAFGASERLVVSPGREEEGIFHMPGGQSGHPLSPYYRAGHDAWAEGRPTPFLPGPAQHLLGLRPAP